MGPKKRSGADTALEQSHGLWSSLAKETIHGGACNSSTAPFSTRHESDFHRMSDINLLPHVLLSQASRPLGQHPRSAAQTAPCRSGTERLRPGRRPTTRASVQHCHPMARRLPDGHKLVRDVGRGSRGCVPCPTPSVGRCELRLMVVRPDSPELHRLLADRSGMSRPVSASKSNTWRGGAHTSLVQ